MPNPNKQRGEGMKKHLPTHIFRWIVLSIFLFCAVLSDAGSISTLTGTEWLIYELNNPYATI